MHVKFVSIFFFTYLISDVLSARILGVFPIPSVSHQVVFRRLYLELSKRGHELTVITPNPALPKNRPKDNVTEIDVGFSYDLMFKELDSIDIFQKGVYADVNTVSFYLYNAFLKIIKEQILFPEVKNLIDDKNQSFDLILVEAYFSLPLIYSYVFKVPVIQISSFHGRPENYETVGGLGSHPKFYPNFNRNKFQNLTVFERIIEIYYEIKLRYEFWKVKQEENKIIKELFGPEAPTIDELYNNVHMLFVNTHPIFDDSRPVPPSVLYLGAFHMHPVKELPKDLKDYLDKSEKGVIYVSLGSNVLPSRMDKELLYNFINAFKAIPYDILWKFDVENIGPLPDNVKTQQWFPQRDLLMHPNVRAFVTQGGLQSTDEAIDAAVPLVGIPMLGDQFYNVNKYVELDIGVRLDALTFKPEDLAKAVKNVVEEDRYRNNIKTLRSLFSDTPMTALERAVWWVEHVIRHKGAKYLRAPAANVSWTEYLELELLAVVIATITIVMLFLFLFLYFVFGCKFISKPAKGAKKKKKMN